jgi:hypothetical protein
MAICLVYIPILDTFQNIVVFMPICLVDISISDTFQNKTIGWAIFVHGTFYSLNVCY